MVLNRLRLQLVAASLATLPALVSGAVTPEQAAQLGSNLTPLGAEQAANSNGTIPAWSGGLAKDAAQVDSNGFLSDPFSEDTPLFVINRSNYAEHAQHLTPGQIALLERYEHSYSIPVYPTRRSATVPDSVFAAAKRNATRTTLIAGGNGLADFDTAVPFPIPENGLEVIWNHITRYRGGSFDRQIIQATSQANGTPSLVTFRDQFTFRTNLRDYRADQNTNLLFAFTQQVVQPARMSGNVLLVREPIDQVAEPRQAWMYNAGQRRVRRAPQVSYDGPGFATDGLRTSDNYDMYNGAPDRYEWTLLGKQEIYIPYNSYRLASTDLKYTDILQPGHINQELARYELHRVWVVEATLKQDQRHIYAKRRFFIDEDSWQAAEIDHYDGRDLLWRVAEAHAMQFYDHQVPLYALETLYDMQSGRYLVLGMTNEEKRFYNFQHQASNADYLPGALRSMSVR